MVFDGKRGDTNRLITLLQAEDERSAVLSEVGPPGIDPFPGLKDGGCLAGGHQPVPVRSQSGKIGRIADPVCPEGCRLGRNRQELSALLSQVLSAGEIANQSIHLESDFCQHRNGTRLFRPPVLPAPIFFIQPGSTLPTPGPRI